MVIVLDPAHGGADTGARINDHLLEKNVSLALSFRLRSLLNARGFTVVSTRESDTGTIPTVDQRAELANHARGLACILLHATASGNGVHIFSSSLPPAAKRGAFVTWDAAQDAYIDKSVRLASELRSAFERAEIPVTVGRTYLRPMDNLTCPAVAVELAPLAATSGLSGKDAQDVSDPAYQQQVAESIAWALLQWRMHTSGLVSGAGDSATGAAHSKSGSQP